MANEKAEKQVLKITDEFIDKIISKFEVKGINDGVTAVKIEAAKWWQENRVLLVGLAISEVATILRNANNRKNLSKQYDALVASMSWKERLEFLKGGIEELKRSNSAKIREAVLVAKVIEIGIKVLPILPAAL